MATKITRLRITNYRGVRALDATISPTGATIAKGKNGLGKSSTIRAIEACIIGGDVGPDAITIGETKGEIIIDLDKAGEALRVRRRLGKNAEVTVTKDPDADFAAKLSKPTTVLAELLGAAPVDVISVVFEKDTKKRRDLILQALPMRVTVEQLRRYVPQLPDSFPCEGHALEVIGRLRGSAYDRRTAANKAAKDAAAEAARDRRAAMEGRAAVPAGAGEYGPAAVAHQEAVRKHHDAEARLAAAKGANERMNGVREQIAARKRSASDLRSSIVEIPTPEEIATKRLLVAAEEEKCAVLSRQLMAAQEEASAQASALSTLLTRKKSAEDAEAKVAAVEADIAALEATITSVADTITEADAAAAAKAEFDANTAVQAAVALDAAIKREEAAAASEAKAKTAEAEAERLDKVVHALTVDAPADILRESAGPEGLELAGDEIKLNGVSLDHLCGAEQMQFAAQIAAALAPGAGFIVVDGLERLDPEQLDAFVAAACAGGRQLFGSLVAAGELVLAHVEPASSSTEAA